MENRITTARLTSELASQHRVVVLGGLAVIAHGHGRPTFDADAWLDPNLEPQCWAEAVNSVISKVPGLRIVAIGSWENVSELDLASVIERDGVIRVMGANQPLDIFRSPNELEMSEFDAVWDRALQLEDGTRVPDAIDLLVTKQSTGRDKDIQDIAFLEAKAERLYLEELPNASADRAIAMLDRFLTPRVAGGAAQHPDPGVRELGIRFLRELSEEGDPFARDILAELVSKLGG